MGKGSPPLLLQPILHPSVTTRLPRARRAPSPDRAPQRGWRTKGAAPSNAAPGNASGSRRTVESATHVDCRLGGAPCPVLRPLAWMLDSGGVGVDRLPRPCSVSRPFAAGLDASALHGALSGFSGGGSHRKGGARRAMDSGRSAFASCLALRMTAGANCLARGGSSLPGGTAGRWHGRGCRSRTGRYPTEPAGSASGASSPGPARWTGWIDPIGSHADPGAVRMCRRAVPWGGCGVLGAQASASAVRACLKVRSSRSRQPEPRRAARGQRPGQPREALSAGGAHLLDDAGETALLTRQAGARLCVTRVACSPKASRPVPASARRACIPGRMPMVLVTFRPARGRR